MSTDDEKEALRRILEIMNRNVSTLEDKANLSLNDFESMNTLSRLERHIVLADARGVSEELLSLSQSSSAETVMQILERDLQSIGISANLIFNQESITDVADLQPVLQSVVGQAVSKTKRT